MWWLVADEIGGIHLEPVGHGGGEAELGLLVVLFGEAPPEQHPEGLGEEGVVLDDQDAWRGYRVPLGVVGWRSWARPASGRWPHTQVPRTPASYSLNLVEGVLSEVPSKTLPKKNAPCSSLV